MNILKIRKKFQRIHRALANARDEALEEGLPGVPPLSAPMGVFVELRATDGTNTRLYAAAVKLKETGVYSSSTGTTTVAYALLKRIHRKTGESWETTIKTYAPEWA